MPAAVEIHAGKAYIEFGLEQRLKDAGIEVVRPLRHLRRGEQLAWYDFAQRYDEPRTQTAPRPDPTSKSAPVKRPPAWARDLREQSTGPFAPSNQRPAPWFVS